MRPPIRQTHASSAWRALLTTFTSLRDVLAKEMEMETGLSLERYEILFLLARTEAGAMRPSELADKRRLSRSGATRMVDRLEQNGLVERQSCTGDGRGSLVALTKAGEQAFLQAGRIHMRGIDRHFGSCLTDSELEELTRLMALVAGGMDEQR